MTPGDIFGIVLSFLALHTTIKPRQDLLDTYLSYPLDENPISKTKSCQDNTNKVSCS